MGFPDKCCSRRHLLAERALYLQTSYGRVMRTLVDGLSPAGKAMMAARVKDWSLRIPGSEPLKDIGSEGGWASQNTSDLWRLAGISLLLHRAVLADTASVVSVAIRLDVFVLPVGRRTKRPSAFSRLLHVCLQLYCMVQTLRLCSMEVPRGLLGHTQSGPCCSEGVVAASAALLVCRAGLFDPAFHFFFESNSSIGEPKSLVFFFFLSLGGRGVAWYAGRLSMCVLARTKNELQIKQVIL